MSVPQTLLAERYRLVRIIATGGMGVVWEAWDERLRRPVAIKELRTQHGATDAEAEQAKNRAMREARITARLHHPHAVPVFDAIEHEGRPCLIMQYLPSTPLSAILRTRGRLEPHETARIGAEIASALAAAHKLKIVHRDVKPGNILVTEEGTAHISDFGISHALGDATLTRTGMVYGTPAYLAPEVARGAESTYASDVFSLGSTLYAALEGQPPFGADPNSIALLHRVASGDMTPPRNAGVLEPFLLDMLSPEPKKRPSMKAVASLLAGLQRDAGSDKPTLPIPPDPRPAIGAGAAPQQAAGDEPAGAGGPSLPWPFTRKQSTPGPAGADDAATSAAGTVAGTGAVAAASAAATPPAAPVPPAPRDAASENPAAPVPPAPRDAASENPATTAITRGVPIIPAPTRSAPTVEAPTEPAPLAGGRPAGDNTVTAPIAVVGGEAPPGARRRRGLVAVLIAAAAVLAAIFLIPALIAGQLGKGAERTPGPAAAPESAEPAEPSPIESSAPADEETEEPPAEPEPTAEPAPPEETAEEPAEEPAEEESAPDPVLRPEDAITSYYALLPGNTDAGWQRLTADYQQGEAISRDYYEEFWGQFRAVSVSDVVPLGTDRVEATVTYQYKGGGSESERRVFVFVEEDGILKIDDSEVV